MSGPGVTSMTSGSLPALWAKGVLRGNTPTEVADIVRNFEPDTVPVLDHHHGDPIGWVRAVQGDGTDLWYTARIAVGGDAECRLRRGPVAVSLEMLGRNVYHRRDERGIILPPSLRSPHFRGRYGEGYTLDAIAILPPFDRPGGKGSCMWAVE